MGLRLGVDFGTATTCVAVMNESTLQPRIVPVLAGQPFVDSLVWFDVEDGRKAILKSTSIHKRHPLSICQDALLDFNSYWRSRVDAFKDFSTRANWASRESAMLLSYFKPELADPEVVDEFESPVYAYRYATNLYTGESMLLSSGYLGVVRHQIARPAPATPDYVAGTAALFRAAVQAAVDGSRQRVSTLAIGMPSFELGTTTEARRAEATRRDALELARIQADFGDRDFKIVFCGEALAAAWGLDVVGEQERPVMLVVDVGAGTTDLSLIELQRARSGKWEPSAELLHHSLRWAGRDLNAAIAHAMMEHPSMRHVRQAMDPRAWQRLLDHEVEAIKRSLNSVPQWYRVPLHELAAHPDGVSDARRHFERLHRVVNMSLGLGDVEGSVRRSFQGWERSVREFLEKAAATLGPAGVKRLAAIELVGGAFRFPLLHDLANRLLTESPFPNVGVNYRDAGGTEAQTVVARGLARRAMLVT